MAAVVLLCWRVGTTVQFFVSEYGRSSTTIHFFEKMYFRITTTVLFFILEAVVAVRQRSFLKICAVVLLRRCSFLKSGEVEQWRSEENHCYASSLLHCSISTFYLVRVRILAEVQRDGIFTGGGNDDFGAVVHELVAEIHS